MEDWFKFHSQCEAKPPIVTVVGPKKDWVCVCVYPMLWPLSFVMKRMMVSESLLSFNCSVDKITQLLAESKSITTGEWSTLYIIIMIRSFVVLLLCTRATQRNGNERERIFHTNSTSINDNNGVCCCWCSFLASQASFYHFTANCALRHSHRTLSPAL